MIELTNTAIDISLVLNSVSRLEAGGHVLFVGTTRQWTASESEIHTDYLIYEAHEEMALKQLHRLASEARQRWGLSGIAIVHRLGKVLCQEASVAIAVSCPHRKPAFEASQWLIDSIKRDVPIWKQEHYVDSSAQWIHPSSSQTMQQSRPT